MILGILWITALVWSVSKCEPPVNSYLPPATGRANQPSPKYGPPGPQSGNFNDRGQAGRGGLESQNNQDSYTPQGQPRPQVDTKYGPPSSQALQSSRNSQPQRGFGPESQPSSQYRAPENGVGSTNRFPSNESPFDDSGRLQSAFNSPDAAQGTSGSRQSSGSTNSNGFGKGRPNFDRGPQTSYGPPPTGGLLENQRSELSEAPELSRRPSFEGPNAEINNRPSFGESPSAAYDAPGFGNNRGESRGSDGDGSDEPANYEFSYDVDDLQTGTKFGHSEKRNGDIATGEYNVVLPDGRKQVVEYEAGLQGYKPQIRYEGSIRGSGSQSEALRGDQAGNEGYPRSSPGGAGFTGNDNSNGLQHQGFGQDDSQLGRPGLFKGLDSSSQQGHNYQNREQQGDSIGYPRGGPSNGRNSNGSGKGDYPEQNRFAQSDGYPASGPSHGNGFNNLSPSKNSQGTNRPQSGTRNSGNGGGSAGGNTRGFDGGYPDRGSSQVVGGNVNGRNRPNNSQQGTFEDLPNNGYPRGGPQGEAEGYPRGGPNGPRGSGF